MKELSTTQIRDRLQAWHKRLVAAKYPLFHFSLSQFWRFLHENPVLAAILDQLKPSSSGTVKEEVEKLFVFRSGKEVTPLFGQDDMEQTILSYYVVKRCVEAVSNAEGVNPKQIEWDVARHYHPHPGMADYDWLSHFFHTAFLDPLIFYLEQELDGNKAVLALLRRYKHRCEWFERERLSDLWLSNTNKGEWLLKLALYEYLHDNGLSFSIDPFSYIGKPDLVACQDTDDPLIADAKIFKLPPSAGKKSVIEGFHQVYKYTLSFNEPFGYLIVFKTCDQDLKFSLSRDASVEQFVQHNNKTIYLITIDIHPKPVQASKRGKLKPFEITERELIQVVEAAGPSP